MARCELVDASNIQQLVDSVDTVFTDCDGVLWNEPNVIDGSPDVIRTLRLLGKRIIFITNNCIKTREEHAKKLNSRGFTVTKEEITTSGYAAAQYIKNKLKFSGKLYVLGSPALSQELTEVGIENIGAGYHPMTGLSLENIANMPLDPEVKGVVVGFDFDYNYLKVSMATAYLRNGCTFIATYAESIAAMYSKLLPGIGSLLAAVITASGRKPDAICGKPETTIVTTLPKSHRINVARSIIIGDRLYSDIQLASNCGMTSLLVLTGVSSLEDVREKQKSTLPSDKSLVPDYYASSLAALAPLLAKCVMN